MAKPAGVWVVASVSNAQAVITHVIERVLAVPDVERLVLIDDGSVDGSVEQVRAFQDHHRQRGEAVPVTLLVLTRPFGRRAAVLAGLDHARGRCGAAVVMTADLRHPPEVIERMIQCWRDGADLVPAVPEASGPDDGDPEASVALPLLRRLLTVLPVGPMADDFCLIAAPVLDLLVDLRQACPGSGRSLAWTGYRRIAVPYQRGRRRSDRVSWRRPWRPGSSLAGLMPFSGSAASFSLWRGVARLVALVVVLVGLALLGGLGQGQALLGALLLGLGALQLIGLALVGDAVGRLLAGAAPRPAYIVRSCVETE